MSDFFRHKKILQTIHNWINAVKIDMYIAYNTKIICNIMLVVTVQLN